MTHTYAILEVSAETFDEIEVKLKAAGYGHAFDPEEGVIDMHGLALQIGDPPKVDPTDKERWDHNNGHGVNYR